MYKNKVSAVYHCVVDKKIMNVHLDCLYLLQHGINIYIAK